ncbi:3-hydroxybutyrate dehydrogenase [Desmospora activa]|uniref:3-hydroxybutyrate dehydrogenase n=1 Tax=Desmospora activa DSM 45169 TaxID=1121389 RepID=A0A2T4ZDG1_9BACL|nr:3-hydroxybutyrate dehydrogenase [Desmospora activa]PTM59925.1 3-hydroxybutyrate dehydrogenase [Desmospora activa DSM 45169]
MTQARTVLITGAARGIGFHVAKAFAQRGDRVAIVDLRAEEAQQAAVQISAVTGASHVEGYQADISSEDAVRQVVKQIRELWGPVEVAINNAGLQHIDRVEDFPLEQWNRLIGVMLTGPFLVTKHVVPGMKEQGWGRIINIASVHGRTASPFKSAYIAAKHGVVGLTRTVALETAEDGITVNAIMPGAVDTPLVRNQLVRLAQQESISEEEALHKHLLHKQALKRFIQPEEVAATAVFLASDGAASITGEGIGVSGGW